MSYADLLWAVRHRWGLVVACMVVTLLSVAIWTAVSPRIYVAKSTLLFDNFPTETEAGGTVAPQASAMTTLLGTQADIIRSQVVAAEVVRDLGLDSQPGVRASWAASTDGKIGVIEWMANVLLANLEVTPTRNTNVMAIAYKATDPDFASHVANGFADAFVRTQLRLRTEPAKVYSDWYRDRTHDVRARYEEAQARLTRYQQEKGLIGGEKLDVELSHLGQLGSQLAGAEGIAADTHSRAATGPSMPEVQLSGLVSGLRGTIAAKTAEIDHLKATLGPRHPQMIAANTALASLNAKLEQAVAQAAQTVQAGSQAATMREAELRQRMSKQRQEVLALSGTQDQLAVLQRDVEAAKMAYDAVTQRLNGAKLRAEIPQTSVSVLDHAAVPVLPVSPKVWLRITLSLLFGLFAGLGLAVLVEWLAPRVRTSDGLQNTVGLATLVNLAEHRHALTYRKRGEAA